MKRVSLCFLLIVLMSVSVLAAGGAEETSAADYPDKPIQIIVPWGAGGRTDINARMFASVAPKYLGQPVMVVNKAGGGSVIGGEFVAKAKPDGYTLLAITPGTNVFPVIYGKAPYTTFDFDAIGQIGSSTMVMASRPDAQWSNVAELVEYAKANPGVISYSCVLLNAPQLGFLRWADAAGLEFKHVPVGNDAEAVESVLGGHVDIVMTSSVATVLSQVSGGNLNPLMVYSEERDASLPDTPTAVELGYGVVASPYTGLAGPKGLDPDVLAKLRGVFLQVIADEDFLKLMNRVGESINPKNGEDFFAVWENDYEGYSAVVNKLGLSK